MAKEINKSKNKNAGKANKPDKSEVPVSKSSEATETSSDEAAPSIDSSAEKKSSNDTERKSYVRGENQTPVTKAYRENWNKIFKKN